MRRNAIRVLILVGLVLLGPGAFSPDIWAAQHCEEWAVRIESVQGTVEAQKSGEKEWLPVELNDTVCSGAAIRTGERSRAAIVLRGETVLRLHQNTVISFSFEEKQQTSLLDFVTGIAHFFSRTPGSLQVHTPYVNALVEGTEFLISVERGQTFLSTFEGRVGVSNSAGSLSVAAGQSAVALAGQPPVFKKVVQPRDAVKWALHYPLVLNLTPEDFTDPDSDWQRRVRGSIELYWKSDLTGAFDSLRGIREDVRDERFFTYRAMLLLTVGDVEGASADLGRALELDPANGQALSLQSVIAVVENNKDEALRLAKRAVELDPGSSTSRIALSYAQQAHFNIEGALESLKEAVRLDPANALAHARLAEMWLSVGHLDRAFESARQAADLNPNLSRTQAVLGFAYLTQIKTRESKEAFTKAIQLDQADPLPRLGLGLAKIRDGDLAGGRREIEIAVSLDPDNSLIRSYLGKAYFEEKRETKAAEQFTIAKELDPMDPTPWFYDAIQKQTLNRPVEALHDLQRSIELNDNRAVYRSRLLLDEDLAARSASLGRIYSDLGFQQLALTEGWKSYNVDPANYSAHRFLADSYLALPRHEVARISELLQSQLLQPINIMPVQPQFKEFQQSKLAVIEQAGLLNPSFNEFTSLFARNRLALQISGLAGENDTFGDELIQSGLWGRASYSIGQFHHQTDGFRKNNDQEIDVYDVFAQVSLSHKTSVQAEVRYTDVEGGDLGLRFDPGDVLGNFRQEQQTKSLRFGLHHAFAPYSDTIASFIYGDRDTETRDLARIEIPPAFFGFTDETTNKGFTAEIQHLLRYDRFSLVGGAGHFSSDRKDVLTQTIFPTGGDPIFFPPEIDEPDISHTNFYLYSMIHYPQNVTWTAGGSADFFHQNGSDLDRSRVNPKLGVTWDPFPTTTLRAALFRTFTRALISSQTIEPTHVAGFNQFFDDPQGTEAWRYGVGIDQKLLASLYGGVEWSKRDLKVPPDDERLVDRNEQLVRTYLYWAAHPWIVPSLEYQYERFESDPDATGVTSIVESDTHRVPLGIAFFHPSGFLAKLKITYVFQTGHFVPQGQGDTIEGDDRFVVCDAAIGYRLPGRWGIITLEGRNLLDEEFQFQDTDPANPAISPERSVLLRFTLSF